MAEKVEAKKRPMAHKENCFKRVCVLIMCVLPLILSGCRTEPTGAADSEFSSGTGQSQQDQWQGTNTTDHSASQDDPDGNTPDAPFDTEDTTQGPTDPPAAQGPTDPPATQETAQSPTADTTVTEESQLPSDPPPASDTSTEDADTTGQETTEETVDMGDESVPANTETGWGPIQ